MSKLNSKTLTIAAVVLITLALLFMATPLLRFSSGFQRGRNFNPQLDGQSMPRAGTGTTAPGGQNGFSTQGSDPQDQGFPGQGGSNYPNRQFGGRGDGLLGFGLLTGMTGIIVYAIALLVSLAAAMGMFITRRWGQVLGIVMAAVYLVLALVSFIPMILMSFIRGLNYLSLGLSILHLVLAIAVIVLTLIPAKKGTTPAIPPAVSA